MRWIPAGEWTAYVKRLAAIDKKAAEEMKRYITAQGYENADRLIDYAYGLATKYGEASAALAAEMYDAIAALEKANVPAAVPAETASYQTVAKTVQGVARQSQNPNTMANAVGRLVKQAGADTMLKNALRDGAQFAWVPSGDTCAFCITLASRGWQKASKKAIKGGHAEHIHANCDCTYAIRFDENTSVAGYDPERYRTMYYGAEGNTPQERINSLRREFREENKDKINAQKRAAYRERAERKNNLTNDGRNGTIKSSEIKDSLFLQNIHVGKSLGGARKSYDIMDLSTGERFDLVDGTWLEHVEVFAGKGTKTPYYKAWKYVKKHPETKEEDWQHVKGIGIVDYYGEPRRAELHWSQCDAVGTDDMFVKRWLE